MFNKTSHEIFKKIKQSVAVYSKTLSAFYGQHWVSIIVAYILLQLSYQVGSIADRLATQLASAPVTDTLLSLFPRIDTSFIHATMSFFLADVRDLSLLFFPRHALFGLKSLTLLILVRAFMVNMTHLGIPDGSVPIQSTFTFGGDLFFSGHTAFPFLVALVFWDIKVMRYFFLGTAVVFGTSAILGHYHYTIDVLAAPFIAHSVFYISKRLFKKDYDYMVQTSQNV